MHGIIRPALTALTLGGLLSGCAATGQTPPPPSPTPSPTPTPMYPKTAYITLFEYPSDKGCRVVALPYHAWVAKDGDIEWDVVDDACPNAGKLEIKFAEDGIVELDQASLQTKKKKGKVKDKAQDYKPHKYSVILGTLVHDPEIEIWP
jgi:hypothetical protein